MRVVLHPIAYWLAVLILGLIDGTAYAIALVILSITVVMMAAGFFYWLGTETEPSTPQRALPSVVFVNLEQQFILEFLSRGPKTFGEIRRFLDLNATESRARATTDTIEELIRMRFVEATGETGKMRLTSNGRGVAR
jgi:hypothetical protein